MKTEKIKKGETIRFCITRLSTDMCRITPIDIRTKFQEIAGGGCIHDLDGFLGVMEKITQECDELGVRAIFEM